jgi:hypothetical protein
MEAQMIQFEVEAHFSLRGGPSSFFSASNPDEVMKEITRLWYSFGLRHDRDEAILIAHFKYYGAPTAVYVGDFIVEEDGTLYATADLTSYSDPDKPLSLLGFNYSQIADPEIAFVEAVKFLFESKNSPDRLLGSWLVRLASWDYYGGDIETEHVLTAHLLNFSDKNGKLFEMYQWCLAPNGRKFFDSNKNFSLSATLILNELESAAVGDFENCDGNGDESSEINRDAVLTKERILKNLRSYIRLYDRALPFELKLDD